MTILQTGLIRLPAPLLANTNGRPSPDELKIPRPEGLQTLAVAELESVRLELVRTKPGARWYRAMMRHHHYLGSKPMAGAQLRYLIWSGNWLLGGLGFGAAAWMVAARDRWIGRAWVKPAAEANWKKNHASILPIKRILVRPLRSDFRDLLCP